MNTEQKNKNLRKNKKDEKLEKKTTTFLTKEEINKINNEIGKIDNENDDIEEEKEKDPLKRAIANTNNALDEIETLTKLFDFFPEETFKVKLFADPHGIYHLTEEEEKEIKRRKESREIVIGEYWKEIYRGVFFWNIFILPVTRVIFEAFVKKCLKKIIIWITKKTYWLWIYVYHYLKNKNEKKKFLRNKDYANI